MLCLGNDYLESVIQNETNWISGTSSQYISTIQRCVAIIMFALRLKSQVVKTGELTPMEHLIFSQNKQTDSLKVVQKVTSYINHSFNKSLPVLCCRLLKKFANVSGCNWICLLLNNEFLLTKCIFSLCSYGSYS